MLGRTMELKMSCDEQISIYLICFMEMTTETTMVGC
jgi:hypothetical protein